MGNRMIGTVCRGASLTGIVIAAIGLGLANPERAAAQAPNTNINPNPGGFGIPASLQINNPAVSPYLNLAQPGINPAVAYQTLVAPQLQMGNAILAQQRQIGVLQQAVNPTQLNAPTPTGELVQTGHATAFLNTQGFFPLSNVRVTPIRR